MVAEKTKTYFVCSDIHGFYKELINSLSSSGFDRFNINHILIVLGDIFDRGKHPWEIFKFLTRLPRERVILVKGNHEYLLEKLVRRKYPLSHDYSNGTYGTLVSLYKDPKKEQMKWIEKNRGKIPNEILYLKSLDHYYKVEAELYRSKKLNRILNWLKSSSWLNYYELGQYIFVHSFIPLRIKDELYSEPISFDYFPDWRDCKDERLLELSTWNCPYKFYLRGYFDNELKKGKTLVCGHYHTALFYNELLYKDNPSKKLDIRKENPIFKSEKFPGLIGLDTCTVLTKKVNILVIQESDIKF